MYRRGMRYQKKRSHTSVVCNHTKGIDIPTGYVMPKKISPTEVGDENKKGIPPTVGGMHRSYLLKSLTRSFL